VDSQINIKRSMEWKEFETTFSVKLNQQQKEAVQSTKGPVLLLAVPGSGKTTVLVTRLGYMIYCKNIPPESILTVTYTVAATKDMSERFAVRFGEDMAKRLEFRTINGICARIIQYYGRRIGKTPFELVKDEKATTGMLIRICQDHGMGYPTESDLKNVRTLLTYIKNMMLNEEELQKLEEESDIRIAGIYREYCRQMREQKLMDYDDQMLYAYNMLRKDPGVLAYFQNRYPYICVDEAQDTSKIQHAIIALLAAGTGNLFMVGDEDQSIYGFRAAYPEALLSFEKKHPGAKVLLMEENFRSNAKIVEAADKFIQKNTLRHEKHMRAAREAGADIREISLKSRKAQYVYLMKAAQECTTGMAGMSGSEEHRGRADASVTETAVLYRDNECAIPLIDLLERKNIPYRMRNADLSFFTHRTVLDVQNIIRFAMDPKDTELFMQIYYRLKLFFNKKDALRYAQISQEKDMEVLDAALKYGNLEKYQEDNIRNLKRQMVRILNMPGDEAVNQILTYMGYQDYLKKMGMNANKLETVKLIGSRVESPEKLLERLEELRTIIQEKVSDKDCPFILSTMHASKGLEYDTVYLLDVMDGILPEKVLANPRTASKEELETYEEERRLFYVGVTRAKNQLNVFTTNKPSKFCSELLGKRNLRENQQKEYAGIKKWGDYSPAGTYGIKGNGMYHGYGTGHGFQKQPGKSYQELADALGEGMIVKHKKFGEGVVVDMEGEHIRIQFGDNVKNMDLKVLARLGMLEI
jgi:DNA helicase-2/ATP-dependent DNA helicase PcrA